jgi:hypothetical protein
LPPSSTKRPGNRTTTWEWQWSPSGGARSIAGLRSKKPLGFSVKPTYSHGITGKSSGWQKCVVPTVCHSTMSVSVTGRSAAVHAGRPAPPGCWLGKSPAGCRSSGRDGVTHKCFVANAARAVIAALSWASSSALGCGMSLYPTGSPQAFSEPWLTIFQCRARSGAAIR